MSDANQQTVVVVGSGMVGLRFCEQLSELDRSGRYRVVGFCEEPRAAYDRVGLTTFFAHRDAERLLQERRGWYESAGIQLHIGDRATEIDRQRQVVRSARGVEVRYDHVVLATGSYPFVPPIPGTRRTGVFVYRSAEDLEHIGAWSGRARRCVVLGGGMRGLEAAKAALNLGLETHVVEVSPLLMPRQLDAAGSRILSDRIRGAGVAVHLGCTTTEICGGATVDGIAFSDGSSLECEMLIVAAGIRPRDDLARDCGLAVCAQGGITVNDRLQTSDPAIFAIGECAVHGGADHGLVAPGSAMAETVAQNLCGGQRTFAAGCFSSRLTLMDTDVATFGGYRETGGDVRSLASGNSVSGVYRKLVFSANGRRLRGGMLVGDVADFRRLLKLAETDSDLTCSPEDLFPESKPFTTRTPNCCDAKGSGTFFGSCAFPNAASSAEK